MEATSSFVPAPISDGIVEYGGNKYLPDARGALVPLDLVKPADKLQDEMVRKIMGYAIAASEQLERLKMHTMMDLAALDQLLEQNYKLVKRGNKGKGNRTYMSHDGLYRVNVQRAESIDFGPQLQVAKTILDELLIEWSAESRPEIRALITRAFNTDKEGQINRSDIFMLLRLEIDDPRWMEAMAAIRDAMRVVGTKEYVRFAHRADPTDDWTSVTVDLARA